MAEHAHRQHGEIDAVLQVDQSQGEAILAGLDIPGRPWEQQPEHHHDAGLEHRAARQHDGKPETEHHQAEILGRAEPQRELVSARRSPR